MHNKCMLQQKQPNTMCGWEKIVTIENASDFKTNMPINIDLYIYLIFKTILNHYYIIGYIIYRLLILSSLMDRQTDLCRFKQCRQRNQQCIKCETGNQHTVLIFMYTCLVVYNLLLQHASRQFAVLWHQIIIRLKSSKSKLYKKQ